MISPARALALPGPGRQQDGAPAESGVGGAEAPPNGTQIAVTAPGWGGQGCRWRCQAGAGDACRLLSRGCSSARHSTARHM
eukprot:scaffold3836_cov417-Prasinococcus_capsulatus_cf.AAC.20